MKLKDSIIIAVFTLFCFYNQPIFSQKCAISFEDQIMITEEIEAEMEYPMPIVEPPYDIPLHIYFIHKEDGTSPHEADLALNEVQLGLHLTNETFPDEMNFYICQIDTIFDDLLFGVNNAVAPFYNVMHDTNAINVYISDGGTGFGTNLGIYLNAERAGTMTFPHELGHFFSLKHTFHLTYCPATTPPTPALFPNDSCSSSGFICMRFDPETFMLAPFCNDCEDDELCECRADGVCDTPVDPSDNLCPENGIDGEPCTLIVDGMEISYFPQYSNIMSYYANRTQFSNQQKIRMMETLLLAYPYLIDDNIPECEEIPEVTLNFEVPDFGKVEYFIQGENEPELAPLSGARMYLENETLMTSCLSNSSDIDGFYALENDTTCFGIIPDYIIDQNILVGKNDNQEFETINDITILDLVRILRHITTVELLTNPYSKIAADVSNDGDISIVDIIMIRRFILNLDESFENVTSWRFFPKYALNNQWDFEADFIENPFTATWEYGDYILKYKETIDELSYLDPIPLNMNNDDATKEETWTFIGVKSGDVDFSTIVNEGNFQDENSDENLSFTNLFNLESDTEYFLELSLEGLSQYESELLNVWGYQFELLFDPTDIDFLEIKPLINGVPIDIEQEFNIDAERGSVKTTWLSNGMNLWKLPSVGGNKSLFSIKFRTKNPLLEEELKEAIVLSTTGFNNIFTSEDAEVLSVNLTASIQEDGNKYKLRNMYPNPVQNEMNLIFEVEEGDTPIQVTISDQFGNYVIANHVGISTGEIIIPVNVSTLSSGVLIAQIKLGQADPFIQTMVKIE